MLVFVRTLIVGTFGHQQCNVNLQKGDPTAMYRSRCHARRILVRPEWRIRTKVRGARLSILYTILYYDCHLPVLSQSCTCTCGYTNNLCNNKNHFTYTKELPSEWCPSQSIYIYRVPFTYTCTISITKPQRLWKQRW